MRSMYMLASRLAIMTYPKRLRSHVARGCRNDGDDRMGSKGSRQLVPGVNILGFLPSTLA